ncbi:uncharacterized protein [Apostichopus japonicus]|uniref:uncharacterized protein n=1 Tax=Stichopus japonicus TaxID=307972 RepID=UPI003AB2A4E9
MEKELYKHVHDLLATQISQNICFRITQKGFKCIFSGKMLKVKQRHSQQLSPQKDQLTLRKEKILLIQLLQHLSRSHLPMFCPMLPVGLDMEQHGRKTSDYTNTHCHIYMILNKRDHTYGRGKHFSQTFVDRLCDIHKRWISS